MRPRFRKFLYIAILAPVMALGALTALVICTFGWPVEDCSSESTINASMVRSPDGAWEADVDERVCSVGRVFGTTDVDQVVALRRPGKPAVRGNEDQPDDMLSTVGFRPLLRWLSPQHLEITVPTRTSVQLMHHSYRGVEISVRFEPDEVLEPERYPSVRPR